MLQTHMFIPCVCFFSTETQFTRLCVQEVETRRKKKPTETHRRILFHAANLFINYTRHKWVTARTNELKIIRSAVHKAKKQSSAEHRQIVFGYEQAHCSARRHLHFGRARARLFARLRSSSRNSSENKESVGDKDTHTHTHVGCQISAERHFFSAFFRSTRFSQWQLGTATTFNKSWSTLCTVVTRQRKRTQQSIKQCNGMPTIKM